MSTDGPPQRIIPASRRRDKPILLKCDRNQPCKTCVDRGLSLSCTYVRHTAAPLEPKVPNSVHDRIDQLEKLVTSLMGGKETDAGSTLSTMSHLEQSSGDNSEIPSTPDRVKFSGDTTSYTNSGHWTSILDGISELKEHLDQIPTSASARDESQGDILGPDLLFGRQSHATKQELLAALPPRSEADQLIDAYFSSMDTAPSMMHRPTFLKEYNTFWSQPFETPTMWLGLLYGILALGARFQVTYAGIGPLLQGDPTTSLFSARMDYYREKVVQCLILANYTKCPPYTVETFFLYFGTEYLRSADTQLGMYLLVGMIVRVAFRMGYHREPSRFSNISPFKAEMRRRLWMVIMSLDLVSSSAVGLPRMIQPSHFDVQEPRNLLEEDLHEDIAELPPSRPETELTQLLYSIVLTRVRNAHAKIMDLMNATSQPPYREILDLDAILRDVYDRVPESTKAMPAENFDGPLSPTAMRRLFLGLTFLKAELVLHRPYIILGRTDLKYEYSRRVCLNAALEMLEFQRKLDAELRPGGKLWSPSWSIVHFLILELDEDLIAPLPATPETARSGLRLDRSPPTRTEIIDALRHAHRIWVKASKRSNEARKVAAAVRLVLRKANVQDDYSTQRVDVNLPIEQHDLTAPSPSFDFNDFVANPSSSGGFAMGDAIFNNPFGFEDIPTDLGTFGEPFNWGSIPADPRMQPYGQYPQRPLFD
ncbi:hypothetical protein N0V83_008718 [Neocucurbitaria cava]|uniref:Xylanolytic transcriptional activator regulatory domain-containing protein n=1 Tax=Neocucurbitaria cava TaxID=798079 RepID=A0A9W9CIY4_9PLEO|nr:hypothetical protein N0V83_008718 [Neocucurbitaria cava]